MALAVTVLVDEGAEGRLANVADIIPGNGDPATVRSSGPDISDVSNVNQPRSPMRTPGGAGELPRTGATVPTSVAVGLGAAALALFALRRRTTV